uniref:Homeobox domain-containing protein n=1 Tax=Leptobrachium leishanense TaxID=445787 RepID=A0A8C5MS55_9ANUR
MEQIVSPGCFDSMEVPDQLWCIQDTCQQWQNCGKDWSCQEQNPNGDGGALLQPQIIEELASLPTNQLLVSPVQMAPPPDVTTQPGASVKMNSKPTQGKGCTAAVRKRKRTQYTKWQLSVLEFVFLITPYPDIAKREELAAKIMVPENNVQIWFQNRRARKSKGCKKDQQTRQEFVRACPPIQSCPLRQPLAPVLNPNYHPHQGANVDMVCQPAMQATYHNVEQYLGQRSESQSPPWGQYWGNNPTQEYECSAIFCSTQVMGNFRASELHYTGMYLQNNENVSLNIL